MTFDLLLKANRDVRHLDRFGPWVGCQIKAMLIISETKIAFLFAPCNCCDMIRMIAFSESILPDVTAILTFSGNELDVCYLYENSKWIASINN